MNIDLSSQIELAAQLIRNSEYVVAFTGAGLSTASGIPDFRSPGSGLWEKNDPFEVASLSAFKNNPEKFFNWIKSLYLQAKSAKPNRAHQFLSQMEKKGIIKSIITQNIDGLHQKSGAVRVIELHGSARTVTCPNCRVSYNSDRLLEKMKNDALLLMEARKADLFLVIGSSLEVYPANTLPEIAIRNGAKLIINTHSKTPMDQLADALICMDVTKSIPKIFELIET